MIKLKALAVVAVAVTVSACGSTSTPTSSVASANGVASGCTPKYHLKTQSAGVLKVGVIEYPPYATVVDGHASGIDGAIVVGFARAACLKVQVQETTFAAAVSSVQTRRVDVAFGDLYRTKARASAVALSDPVYLDQLAIVSKQGFGSIAALRGRTIAAVQGYEFVPALQKLFGNSLHVFADSPSMYRDVFTGRSQALLDSYPPAVNYLKQTGHGDFQVKVAAADPRIPGTGTGAAQTTYAYDRADAGLGNAINSYLAQIRGNGELATILVARGLPASAAKVGAPRFL